MTKERIFEEAMAFERDPMKVAEERQKTLKRSPTTETPISTSENPYLTDEDYKAKLMDMPADERKRYIEGVFDPAPGVDLTNAYADRMAVRVERDKIAEGEHLPEATGPHAKTTLLPGRQTSPELAALAAKYINFDATKGNFTFNELSADVRRLAASVLSQVNG